MSAQMNIKTIDLHRVEQIAKANVAMLTTMHGGLLEILRCEVSLDGGIAQRYIAEQTIIAVENIAASLEVKADA